MLAVVAALTTCRQQQSMEEWEEQTFLKQPPEKVMDAAGVKPGMVVGEVGAGRGRLQDVTDRNLFTRGPYIFNAHQGLMKI